MMDYVWLIPLFPLIGFLINGLVGKSLPKKVVGTIGSAAVGLSFLLTVAIFLEFLKLPAGCPRGGKGDVHLDRLGSLHGLGGLPHRPPLPDHAAGGLRA